MVAKMKDDGLIRHLKNWGLSVETEPNWRDRGRPYNFYPRAIFIHHDASGSTSGNFGARSVVTSGRSDLPGPLSQFVLGRDGTVVIIAAGYANHAGYGGPRASVPKDMGNTYAVGIEAANNGVGERWSSAQLNAYYRLCAALMVWLDIKDVSNVFGHKEWTPRKIDPAGIDMNNFRAQVSKALKDGPRLDKVTVNVNNVKKGLSNADVAKLKRRLRKRGYAKINLGGGFRVGTERAVKNFQKDQGLKQTGLADWEVLRRLGFKVVKK